MEDGVILMNTRVIHAIAWIEGLGINNYDIGIVDKVEKYILVFNTDYLMSIM